jgi:ATP-dependent RNA helicase RhlE
MTGSTNAAKAAPINTFAQFDLAPFLQKTIEKIGFTEPTPIQADAIPRILDGKDVMGLAQTGTGKTVAFVLPLVQRVCSERQKAVQAVILTPTRELADQVNDVVRQFTPRTGVKSTTIYGGVSHRSQITALRSNPQIIVACPGRLLDHISAKTIDLSQVDHLVLDEADRMLDMGFMPDIKKIIATLPKDRQTLLFSATMPDEIAELSDNVLRKPEVIKVKTNQPVALVNHSMFSVKRDAKLERFINLMKVNNDSVTVVFTKMKYTAKRLGEQLTKAGVAGVALHGNLSQAQRKRALQGFRDGKYRVLIATDIASRGIDVQGITHVVNYDMPDTLEAYIHRTGRVGRASNTGEAISFVMRSDKDILRSVEKWLGHRLSQLNTDEPKEDDMNRADSESKTRDDAVASKSSKDSRERTKKNRAFRPKRDEKQAKALLWR